MRKVFQLDIFAIVKKWWNHHLIHGTFLIPVEMYAASSLYLNAATDVLYCVIQVHVLLALKWLGMTAIVETQLLLLVDALKRNGRVESHVANCLIVINTNALSLVTMVNVYHVVKPVYNSVNVGDIKNR